MNVPKANPEAESKSIEAKPWPDLVAKYSLFKEKLNPKTDVVYYPCGAKDVSPSAAFPNSKVIYVEKDENAVKSLLKGGYEAYGASALEFDPGNVDILILLNPQISPKIPSSRVVKGGYVLCNDYHGTASSLHQDGEFEIKAMIRQSRDRQLIFDTDNLEDYWQEVDTEDGFRSAPFSFRFMHYKMAASVVETVTGKRENILAEYKKIILLARGRSRQTLAEHPELRKMVGNPDEEETLIFNEGGRQFILSTALPRRKGTVDDLFVFQKK